MSTTFTTFIDLMKAFNIVSREGLWKSMSKFGCPGRLIQAVEQFNDGIQAQVLDGGEAFSSHEWSETRLRDGLQ